MRCSLRPHELVTVCVLMSCTLMTVDSRQYCERQALQTNNNIFRAPVHDGIERGPPAQSLYVSLPSTQVNRMTEYNRSVVLVCDGKFYMQHFAHLDPQAGVIPLMMNSINFTWFADRGRYLYQLTSAISQSHLSESLQVHISVPQTGIIPDKPTEVSIGFVCGAGAAQEPLVAFTLRLDVLHRASGRRAFGFPLQLKLSKQCQNDPAQLCVSRECANSTACQQLVAPDTALSSTSAPSTTLSSSSALSSSAAAAGDRTPTLPCHMALCFPRCQHGGTCVAPGRCRCPSGYIGPRCEGGICRRACLNGGKCVQKDTCRCRSGFYGNICQFSRCVVPCQNRGQCIGANRCRCRKGYSGSHCERVQEPRSDSLRDRSSPSAITLPAECRRRHRRLRLQRLRRKRHHVRRNCHSVQLRCRGDNKCRCRCHKQHSDKQCGKH